MVCCFDTEVYDREDWFQTYRAPVVHLVQGRNRHIFLRGQSHFSLFFFPAWNAFPREKIPILVDPKQISVVFKSEKQKKKKKKKKSPHLFLWLSYFHFQFSSFPFFNFPSFPLNFHPFPFFPSLFFPDMSAKICRSEVSGGTLPPCLLRHWPCSQWHLATGVARGAECQNCQKLGKIRKKNRKNQEKLRKNRKKEEESGIGKKS